MIPVVYGERALEDLERLADFARQTERDGEAIVDSLVRAIETLASSPFVGRPYRGALRELIISWGKTGYVALYRIAYRRHAPRMRVEVLSIRHQREAGYS